MRQIPQGARGKALGTYDDHWALTASPDLELSELRGGFLVSF